MKLLSLSLAALIILAGCDSQGDNNTGDTGCEGEVTVLAEPPNMVVYLGEDPASIRIGGDSLSFEHSAGRALSYSGLTGNQDVVRPEVVLQNPPVLQLLPIRSGSAKVQVQAEDNCGLYGTASFNVEVRDICTELDRAGLDVFFPVSDGKSWTYNYEDLDHQTGRSTYRTEGDMTWVINSVSTCLWGEQTFSISEDIEGVVTLPFDDPDYEEAVTIQNTRSGALRGRRLIIEGYTDSMELNWLYPSESSDTLTTTLDTDSQSWEAALVRATGLVHWQTMFSDGSASRETGILLTEQ